MHLTHMIIDDFFPDPAAVRRAALELAYPPRPEKATYPGRNADRALPLKGIERLISDAVHEPLAPIANYSHAVPRIALAGDTARASVHIDISHWSGIVYLTLPDHERDGTHFFKHKQTGWDRAPVFSGEAEAAGFSSNKDAVQAILDRDGDDISAWERIMTIPMKFNRLALFRGYLWHDAGQSFGETPNEGRLILPFFFENTSFT